MIGRTGTFTLAALALFAAEPALAVVTCDPLERGSLSGGAFIPGTAAGDTDYRLACRGDEGDAVTLEHSDAAHGADGADAIVVTPDLRYVFDLDGVRAGFYLRQFRRADAHSGVVTAPLVFRGNVRVAAGATTQSGDVVSGVSGIVFGVSEDLRDDLFVDSYADVRATGGGRGIELFSRDADTDKAVRARNFGAIVTEGAPVERETWLQTGHGVWMRSDGGDAEASNEAGATITTRGDGAHGVRVRVNGAYAATAVNRGTIVTHGDVTHFQRDEFQEDEHRSDGLVAFTTGGVARAVNEAGAVIRTEGVSAWGMRAQNWSDAAGRAEASNSGEVETTGAGSWGMRVRSNSGDAAATNAGSIITRGEPWVHPDGFTRYAPGVSMYAPSGTAAATNADGGEIETHGAGAYGMAVRSDSAASGTNAGSIVTRGNFHMESDGDRISSRAMSIWSETGDAAATNAAGGEIETHGSLAIGMRASSSTSGVATAVNEGAIVTHSLFSIARSELSPDVRPEWADDKIGASGISARSGSGGAAVTHTGSVTVHGDGSAGIYAGTGGSGTARVTMTGGRVTAGGTGVWMEAVEGVAEAAFSDGARVEAPTALLIRSRFAVVDVCDSVLDGRVEFSGGRGTQRLNLCENGVITGPIVFDAETDPPEASVPPAPEDPPAAPLAPEDAPEDPVCAPGLSPSQLERIWNAGGAPWDELCVDVGTAARILEIPEVIFGSDDATPSGSILSAASAVQAQTGAGRVVAFHKTGAGTARLNEVTLPGSSIVLKEGGVELRRSVNLGAEGAVTVHDATRLTILVGDVTEDADDHGSLTAGGGVTFLQAQGAEEAPTIHVQVAPEAAGEAAAIQEAIEEATFQPIRAQIMKRAGDGAPEGTEARAVTEATDGETTVIGRFSSAGTASIDVPEGKGLGVAGGIEEPEAAGGGGGGGDSGPAIAIGGGALLAFIFGSGLFDDAGAEEAALDDCADARRGGWCTSLSLAAPGSPAAVEERARLGGLETWTRLVGTDTAVPAAGIADATAESLSLGMDARLPGGFRLGVAATPEMTASKSWRPGAASGAALQGSRFALRAGWRDGPLFADAELSQGRYESRATLDNPAVGGALSGTLGLVQRQARATAGARIDLGGVRLTPALSPFAGALRQDAWTAESAALTADVPGASRRYSGVKAGLGVASAEWLPGPGGLRWRPGLRFSALSVDADGPSSLAMRQSDKAGVLSFASRGAMADLPRRVHGLAAAATVAGSGDWRLRLGYAGMEVDGDVEHGAGLRLQARF